MAAMVFRLTLLVSGLALGEFGLTSFGAREPIWLIQIALSVGLLVAGSAGFMQPLLRGPEGGDSR